MSLWMVSLPSVISISPLSLMLSSDFQRVQSVPASVLFSLESCLNCWDLFVVVNCCWYLAIQKIIITYHWCLHISVQRLWNHLVQSFLSMVRLFLHPFPELLSHKKKLYKQQGVALPEYCHALPWNWNTELGVKWLLWSGYRGLAQHFIALHCRGWILWLLEETTFSTVLGNLLKLLIKKNDHVCLYDIFISKYLKCSK